MSSCLNLCLISLCSPSLPSVAELLCCFPVLQLLPAPLQVKTTITRCQKLTKSSILGARSLKYIYVDWNTPTLCPSLRFHFSLSFSVDSIPTDITSQSTLRPQAPVSHKLDDLYRSWFFWSTDRRFVRDGECILFDFIVRVRHESCSDLLHEDECMCSLLNVNYNMPYSVLIKANLYPNTRHVQSTNSQNICTVFF